jgi:hypothetical protein
MAITHEPQNTGTYDVGGVWKLAEIHAQKDPMGWSPCVSPRFPLLSGALHAPVLLTLMTDDAFSRRA